jgi:dipeptidyl aminopeptidase/acylaminoacyl peptidase
VTYAEPGYVLFVREGKVMAQPFDARSLALGGSPVALGDAPPVTDMDAESIASASTDGKILFPIGRYPDTQLEWLDREGTVRGTLALQPGPWRDIRISPDARYAAVTNGDDIWRVDLSRSVATRLTSNGAVNLSPVWSPDGSQIACEMSRAGREEILVMSADGSREPRELPTTSDLFKNPEQWVGDTLFINNIGAATYNDVLTMQMTGGSHPQPLLQTRFRENNPRISPDGRWIAYLSDEAESTDAYIQSYPGLGHKVRVSRNGVGGSSLWWMPGSDEILYPNAANDAIMSVGLRRSGSEIEPGDERMLFKLPPRIVSSDFTADGQRALVSVVVPGQESRKLRVILDWTGLVAK